MQDNFEQNSLKGVQAPKLCYTAGGMLIHEKKVLLVKHKKLGIWLNPGGHIDEGELPHEAAQREFFEETGVQTKALDAFSLPAFKRNFSLVGAPNSEVAKSESTNLKAMNTPEHIAQFEFDEDSGFQPNPITTNLHWVNKESYTVRLQSDNPERRHLTKLWKRGCEQHLGFLYLLKPVAGVEFYQNEEETDGIAWFGLDEIDGLETHNTIRDEIKLGFTLVNK